MMYKGLYNFQLYSLHKQSILMYLGVECIEIYASITKVRLKITIYIKLVFFVSDNRPKNNGIWKRHYSNEVYLMLFQSK